MGINRAVGLFLGLLVATAPAAATLNSDTPPPAKGVAGEKPAPEPPAPAHGEDATAISGAYTYRTHCAGCHGSNGKGDGPLSEVAHAATNTTARYFARPRISCMAGRGES